MALSNECIFCVTRCAQALSTCARPGGPSITYTRVSFTFHPTSTEIVSTAPSVCGGRYDGRIVRDTLDPECRAFYVCSLVTLPSGQGSSTLHIHIATLSY